jgi:hypothetical protein
VAGRVLGAVAEGDVSPPEPRNLAVAEPALAGEERHQVRLGSAILPRCPGQPAEFLGREPARLRQSSLFVLRGPRSLRAMRRAAVLAELLHWPVLPVELPERSRLAEHHLDRAEVVEARLRRAFRRGDLALPPAPQGRRVDGVQP